MELRTERLILRRWRDTDRAPFAAMNADPEVMRYFPWIYTRAESDKVVDRFEAHFEAHGYGLWAVERLDTHEFIGFVGLSLVEPPLHFAPAVEIGWRLARPQWKQGFASEAARRALDYGFTELDLDEIVSFTSELNLPSERVMQRIGMSRDAAGDFDHPVIGEGDPLRRHILYRLTKADWTRSRAGTLPSWRRDATTDRQGAGEPPR